MSEVVFSRSSLAEAELPLYEGIPLSRVTLVNSPALAANAIGFDSESKPTLLKGDVATGLHLVQLAIDART